MKRHGLACCALHFYMRPEPPWTGREVVNNVASRDRIPSQQESEESAACRSEI